MGMLRDERVKSRDQAEPERPAGGLVLPVRQLRRWERSCFVSETAFLQLPGWFMLARMDQCCESHDEEDDIPFTPVPVRARRDGWTPERQRAFIRALSRIGSANSAARSVGMSLRSAHKLRARAGAESFAAAWDRAVGRGEDNVRDHVIDRVLHGAVVPRFRKGRQTGLQHRYYDGVAIAVLTNRGLNLGDRLREAEEKGARDAYFNIERKAFQCLEDAKFYWKRWDVAQAKLARLVAAGLIGPDWLDPDDPDPPLPEPETRRRGEPRIRML